MQDRVPQYPGRLRLVSQSGQYYTFERADNPSQAGTPLNKFTLLQDSTAALVGLGTGAVPDDMFVALATNRTRYVTGSYTGNGTYGSGNAIRIDFPFTPRLVIILSSDSNYFGPSGSANIYSSWMMLVNGVTKVSVGYYTNDDVNVTWSSTYVSFYTTEASPGGMCNANGKTYRYIMFG